MPQSAPLCTTWSIAETSSPEWNDAPGVFCTQWSGHSTCGRPATSMTSPAEWPGWLDANDACPAGCQSCVATTSSKPGVSALATGTTESPSTTGREPNGMKSFWMSTSRSARIGQPLPFSASPRACRTSLVRTSLTLFSSPTG